MIDWSLVGYSALWIVGLGSVTAGLSIANYMRSEMNWRFGRALRIPSCRIMIGLGLVLFCLGLAGGVSTLWEQILWVVLALVFFLQIWQTRKFGNP
jgi:hypothetical protein